MTELLIGIGVTVLAAGVGFAIGRGRKPPPAPPILPSFDFFVTSEHTNGFRPANPTQSLSEKLQEASDAAVLLDKLSKPINTHLRTTMMELVSINQHLTDPMHKLLFQCGWAASLASLRHGLESTIQMGEHLQTQIRHKAQDMKVEAPR